jgi:polygalacturonase
MANARAVSLIARWFSLHVAGAAIACVMCLSPARASHVPATMPSRSWNVTDFGAVGDSNTPSADAINAAIKACSAAGGGRVIVPKGTFLCTPIQLQSNVDLHLDDGATLLFSRSIADYPLALVDNGSGPEAGVRSPIWGEKLQNVSITGSGVINGSGDVWRSVKKSKVTDAIWDQRVKSGGVLDAKGVTWYPEAISRDGGKELTALQATVPLPPLETFTKYRSLLRPHLVRLVECQGVLLDGVTFRDSGSWNVHLSLCDDVKVQHVTIFNPEWAQNGDGIDIDSCRNVIMTDSRVNAGDDGICLKSGMDEAGRKRARPTQNVTITRCWVGTGHGGVVIGSEMSGDVRNVNVSDCVFAGTGNGLRFKSVRGRGGVVENVTVNHVDMSDIQGVAILFDLFYTSSKDDPNAPAVVSDRTPTFRHFSINNVTCKSAKQAFQVRGLPERPLEDLSFNHINLQADDAGTIELVDGLTLNDVHVTIPGGKAVAVKQLKDFHAQDTTGLDLSEVNSAAH